MEAAQFDETLRALKQQSPFRPFTVMLVNGDRVEVDHPDAIVVRSGVAGYISAGGVSVLFDHEGVSKVIGDPMGESNV